MELPRLEKVHWPKRLAKKLKYLYIDSGAMYRALTLYAIQNKYISKSHFDSQKLIEDIPNIHIDFQYNQQNNKYEVHLNNNSVEKHIRSLKVSNLVSQIATVGELRKHLVKSSTFFRFKKWCNYGWKRYWNCSFS